MSAWKSGHPLGFAVAKVVFEWVAAVSQGVQDLLSGNRPPSATPPQFPANDGRDPLDDARNFRNAIELVRANVWVRHDHHTPNMIGGIAEDLSFHLRQASHAYASASRAAFDPIVEDFVASARALPGADCCTLARFADDYLQRLADFGPVERAG